MSDAERCERHAQPLSVCECSPIARPLVTIHVHELESGDVWGEVIEDGERLTELTEDSLPELLEGFAEILEPQELAQ